MDQRQTARKNAEQCEAFAILLKRRAVQQIQTGKQKRPSEKRCALRDEHVRNGVDPFDAHGHVICRRFIERGEKTGQFAGILPPPRKKRSVARRVVARSFR